MADNYSKELDKLFGTDSECENDYSDISNECDSDFSVQDEDNLEQAGVTENTKPQQGETRNADENSSIIELMREFISTEEKAGQKINNDLASVVNNGLRKRANNEDKLKELSKKYTKPANVTTLTVPRINVGIWKQMSSEHKMRDVKLQRIQNILGKATCPLLYMFDLFVAKSSKNEGMSKKEIKSTTQLCKAVYQLVQVTYSDITFRRRAFVKDDLQDRYKGLCNEDKLFGDDINEKVKELDAEFSTGRKIRKNNTEPGERSRRSFVPNTS